ncbi:hypothetical protein Tco_1050553 [Tanacetum coccineum]
MTGFESQSWLASFADVQSVFCYGSWDADHVCQVLVECSSSPKVTASDICPNGQDISSLNPRRGPVMGGDALNFTVSIARISFGVFVRVRVGDTVHEPIYPHALWCSTNMHAFCFESFHEGFHQFSLLLLDMVDFHGVLYLRISSLAYFLLWLGFSPDLLVLLLLFTYLCRGATLGLSRECMLLLLSPNRLKTFLSSGPSLVNIVALTGLLRRVGLSLLCLSLENTLAICEGRVPLEAVTGLCLLFLGLIFLSHDSDFENWVCEFRYFPKPIRGEVPRIVVGCLLAPLVAIFRTVELAGVWAGFAGYTSRGAVGVWPSWILPGPGLGPLLVVWPKPAVRLVLYVINAQPYS